MPQKTNLNISPYYDDFNKDDNFYKILFKPGYPVQARELTGLQSLLQNQVESFGKHIFKEGSMVIPGNIELDNSYFAAKINDSHLGIDVSVYLNEIIASNGGKGLRVRGQTSGTVAVIKNYILPPAEGVDNITIFIKYQQSGTDGESAAFPDGEILILEEPLTYGNTTLTIGETVLTLVSEEATATGTAFGVNAGVYFLRGSFVDVPSSLIILEPYSTTPSYRVGFDISEEVINSNDDDALYDNAKGFTNFAAPGADRFKISVKLAKKALDDYEDTNFVELMRTDQGEIKKLQDTSTYSELKKYFAKRTYDESGDYSVEPFRLDIQESLNNEIGNNGLFTEDRLTDEGNTPGEDLLCIKLSPGRAYVKGFDVDLTGTTVLDVDKPRDIETVNAASIPFEMGSMIRVNNVQGTPFINIGGGTANVITLSKSRKVSGSNSPVINELVANSTIGEARVYSYNVTDASYSASTTQFDLYLYDIQTFTILKCNAFTNANVIKGSRVRGKASGAEGYAALDAGSTGVHEIAVSETTGTFIKGEQLVINERAVVADVSVKDIVAYTVDDIKSVFQDADGLSSGLLSNFSADTVLYEKSLSGFSVTDQLNITGNTATVNNRNFAAKVGIHTDAIIAYQRGDFEDIVYNKITDISVDGKTLTLGAVGVHTGVNRGEVLASGISTSSPFRLVTPIVQNLDGSGIFTELPKPNIASVNLADSNLVISKQITGGPANISSNSIQFASSVGLTTSVGITSVFFEPFDAERYSIHYSDGTTEPLTDDQVEITNNGNLITFNGLSKSSGSAVVNVTLKKLGLTSKTKDFVRSQKVEVTRTVGVSTLASLLEPSGAFGLRVEDVEISLNVPDVVNVVAVLESKDANAPVLDKLKFIAGLNLNTNAIVGELIVGKDSRAIGQIVDRNVNDITFIYMNDSKFQIGEVVNFKESAIESVLQGVELGNYIDRTENYVLDKGHKEQYCDYSSILRNQGSAIPSKRLLIIFDQYQVASGNVGDIFTVGSYGEERYSDDLPVIGDVRASDVLDFRPRVNKFVPDGTAKSPFAFSSRTFESTTPFVISPGESSFMGFSFYLGRVDKLVIDKDETVTVVQGVSAENPVPPSSNSSAMEVATIIYPPYLYNVKSEPEIRMRDNRRFTMRDIANLEKRIENLETITSLSALELDTNAFQVKDTDGLNRFKTGFVVNDFKNRDFIDFTPDSGSRCDIDTVQKELISAIDFWSMNPELALNPAINTETADLDSNLQLLDPNCKKTGDFITLDYEEVDWIENPQATGVENVNPFNVIAFNGSIKLDPPSDNWTRTIYVNNVRTESTGARWVEQSNVVSNTAVRGRSHSHSRLETRVAGRTGRFTNIFRRRRGHFHGQRFHQVRVTETRTQVTRRIERSFTNTLVGPSEERDFVESTKITGRNVDQFMRSRNVYFQASGLKPFTRHYHFLDSGIPDIVPKLVEIEMSSGTFSILEDVKVELNGTQIALIRSQEPNHKVGDESRPEFSAGLGSPASNVEKYTVDPYDRARPAPSATYSATSRLFNVDVTGLANLEKYSGYLVKGAKLTGQSSGAVATVTSINLNSDNWGDLIGAFFFRNANTTPKPPTLFTVGTKTFRVTSSADGTLPIPGSAALSSSASGTYLGTGTVLTQQNNVVQVRNPPRPPQRENEVEVRTSTETSRSEQVVRVFGRRRRRNWRRRRRRGRKDPLAQSFTVDGTGAFLTSFDVYFAAKDETAKLTVQLATVELGIPTINLVQDFTEVVLNPSDINISGDASVPTTIRFPSPVFLPPDEEYALIFLCPQSDKYEMWVSTMGQKSIKTTQLPDVQNVIVSKQYIGGSLFKSQNGTIWTPSQNQDLTFKLRKAKFVDSGNVRLYNTPIEPGNRNCQVLPANPIRSLPRKLIVKIDGSGTRTNSVFPLGRKVSTGAASDLEDQSVTGIIEGQGAPVTNEEIATGGRGYSFSSATAVPTVALTGSGTGLTVNVTLSGEVVTGVAINNGGTGYQVGDVFTFDNSNAQVIRGAGFKGAVTGVNSTFDTLYLTDVQGEKFTNNETLVHYGANNTTRTVATNVAVNGDSTQNGDLFAGNVFEVTQYNHAHHGATNKVEIVNVKPDTTIVPSTNALTAESTTVSLANTAPFASFQGISTDRGTALIEEEVVSYVLGTGQLTLTRGVLNTTALPHVEGASVQTYEVNGVSLAGINTIFTVPTNATLVDAVNVDNYYLEVNRTALDPLNQRTGNSLLCFTNERALGGNTVKISQNHQYSTFAPNINFITPGTTTDVTANLRTISGTSADGTEISFLDQGVIPTTLGETTFLPTPRLIASKINEDKLTFFPKSKSIELSVDMTTADDNLSPVLDIKNATFVYGRNKINNPVGIENYATDSRTNSIDNDPHGSRFVTEMTHLSQPATSLKVLISANRAPEADFRVFYRLLTADSTEVGTTFRPFPGFKNMKDLDGDGFGDEVIDEAKNDGRPDASVSPNIDDEFSDYQFSVDELEQFSGFAIKIVMITTNESEAPRFRDFRAIALA